MLEQFFSPGGYWICLSLDVSGDYWTVRVFNFATWKHKEYEFDNELAARAEADRWRL